MIPESSPSALPAWRKLCPHCGQELKAKADICKYCKQDVRLAPLPGAPLPNGRFSQIEVLQTMTEDQRLLLVTELKAVKKNPTTALLLTLFLGDFGAHKFYLGEVRLGIVYLLFCWTGIPAVIGLFELFFIRQQVDNYNAAQMRAIAARLGVPQATIDSVAPVVEPRSAMSTARITLTVFAMMIALIIAAHIYHDHQDFLAWKTKRDGWLAKCRQYTDQPRSSAFPNREAEACDAELQPIMAEAKLRGWEE